jgi:hypothetical protein
VLIVTVLVELDSEGVLIDTGDPSNIGTSDIGSELGIVALANDSNGSIHFGFEISHFGIPFLRL